MGFFVGRKREGAAYPKNPTINPTGCARFAATPRDSLGQNILTRQRVSALSEIPRDPPKTYSMFCTCSRICSTSTFISTEIAVNSIAGDFEPSVFASRCNS